MKRILHFAAPPLVLAFAIAGAVLLVQSRPEIEARSAEPALRAVEVWKTNRTEWKHEVVTHGVVKARTETTLIAEVTGRIVSTSPNFVEGGFVDRGEVLLEIDPSIYEANVASAEATLKGAEAALAREEAEAALARREWENYGEGEANPLVLREPQLAEAQARVSSAEAALRRAQLDLDRTRVRAPYDARIRTRSVEEGQYVTAGNTVVQLYATDVAEVRLPVSPDELAFLDLPLGRALATDELGPRVLLVTDFGGERHETEARIVRTEAEVDPRTRVVHAVARIEDPYRRESSRDRPPLLVGIFVEARITGRSVDEVSNLPREALQGTDWVWAVDDESRLVQKQIRVLRRGPQSVLIGDGLEGDERVVLTPLDIATPGMKVRVTETHSAKEARP